MIVEVRSKNQITIPKEISKSMHINVGDQFEMIERNGTIYMIPVVTYPKAYVDELEKEVEKFDKDYAEGKVKGYSNVKDLIASLEDDK